MATIGKKSITPPAFEEAPPSHNDIEELLRKTGHHTCSYPNGFTIGVRLEGIPRTRGVHADVVLVLDLRVARFGASGLAMRAAVLETASRPLSQILSDVGLGAQYQERFILTPAGKVNLTVLRDPTGKSTSYIHETRNVYVITGGTRPSFDLSWLTDPKRVVQISEFALLRNSDARAMLPVVTEKLSEDKWASLERGVKLGWYSLLPVIALFVGLAALWTNFGSAPVVPYGPLTMILVSLVLAIYLLRTSRTAIQTFEGQCTFEVERLGVVGDWNRIGTALRENSNLLKIVGDLSFTVSPLMAGAAEHLRDSNLASSISLACSILDECVRSSPSLAITDEIYGADEGLNKFLGFFESIAVPIEKERLALAYVAFTGYPVNSISEGEAAEHLGVLNDSLFDAGILRPQVKAAVDDILNEWALRKTAKDLSHSLETEEESTELSVVSDGADEITEEEKMIATEIVHAGVDSDADTADVSETDEIPTIEAEDA